jgi:hypothetical protein
MSKTTKPESENPKIKNITLRVTEDLRTRADTLRDAHFPETDRNAFFAYLVRVGIQEEETRFEEERLRREARLKAATLFDKSKDESYDAFDPEAAYEIIRDRSDGEWEKTADNIIDRAREKLNDPNWGNAINIAEGPQKTAGKRKYKEVIKLLQEIGIDPFELQLMDNSKE